MYREVLIRAQSKYTIIAKEASFVYRSMIDHLNKRVVFFGYMDIEQTHQSIVASSEHDIRSARMEINTDNVVVILCVLPESFVLSRVPGWMVRFDSRLNELSGRLTILPHTNDRLLGFEFSSYCNGCTTFLNGGHGTI